MIIKINAEQPFQVLSTTFSIGPSSSGYDLMASADGVNYSKLFTVGANVNRQVTQVAAGSYYYLSGNTDSAVTVNWYGNCVVDNGGGGSYVLPVASQDTLGGVKIGSGLTMSGDTLNANPGGYTLPIASENVLGGVKIGSGLTIDENGVLSASGETYELPAATDQVLGGIKVGSGLTIDSGGTLSADIDLSGYATTADTDALSAVTSGLTEAVAGKQDTLSAGNGIDLSGSTISVKIGEGLAFSGDTLVTSGGGGATTYILNRMSQQERKDLFDELFEYRDGYGVSSGFPAGNYAFYYNENSGDDFNGLIPLTIVMMHPTDYGGGIFFTGLAKNRYNGTNLRLVRYVITSDGGVDENRYGAGFGISTAGYNFSWTGDISVDLDNGNIIKRGDETLVTGNTYSDFESDSSLLDMMQKGLKFEPVNTTIYSPTFKISLISSGTTKTYYKPVIYYEEISPETVDRYTFSKKFYFVYTKEDGGRFCFSFLSRSSNIAANFEYQALS